MSRNRVSRIGQCACACVMVGLVLLLGPEGRAGEAARPGPGDGMLREYFRSETAAVERRSLADVETLEDWEAKRGEHRRQLAEMLGLWPEPERTDLKVVITGRVDHADFTVEKLHFQSRPGLYVTANLYVPKGLAAPAPAILYVCGHAQVKKDGIAYGAKAFYQHHGAWFARNGYVCLIPDTLVNGEIEGLHHGTYRNNLWWWTSRGYTPAGVEAWNGIRCLDYLQSRKEVDPQRIGMTGRSGGGAYSWWVGALDERVKVCIPVAGITDMQNHVVDNCIEGHCDCMYMVNTYRWDFAQVAALVAPRPLLISNSDKDSIFPLDGVVRLHSQVRRVYELHKAADKLGLLITEGPHKDTQDLQVPAFRWFNRFLKNDVGPLKDVTAEKLFQPEDLKVFPVGGLPADQINTRIGESFVPAAGAPVVPESAAAWAKQRDQLLEELKHKTFGGWPAGAASVALKPVFDAGAQGMRLGGYEFESQPGVMLRMYVLRSADAGANRPVVLRVPDQVGWETFLSAMRPVFAAQLGDELRAIDGGAADEQGLAALKMAVGRETLVFFAPRGVGLTAWGGDERKRTHILRRFAQLGQTLDGMQVWDVRRAVQGAQKLPGLEKAALRIEAEGRMAGVVLYASLFEKGIAGLQLSGLPVSHQDGPALQNVLRFMDLPAAVAMAAERCEVRLRDGVVEPWTFPRAVVERIGLPDGRLMIERP